jgi:hypothetical protein
MNSPLRPSYIARSKLLLAVIEICGPTCISPALCQTYLGIDLYTLTEPSGFVGSLQVDNASSGIGQVVSYGTLASGKSHALLWNGPAGTVVDLHPTNLSGFNQSFALRTSGTQQVGEIDKANGVFHAVLWSGAASTAVDLNPTNLTGYAGSTAYGISGSQQVGLGGGSATANNTHALLWNGAANTAVDLHPTNLVGFTDSEAFFTDGANQVGDGDGTATGGTNHVHAMLWSGAANTAVDLHPTSLSGFSDSSAEAVSGNQEVGEGNGSSTGFSDHALVWSGTAASAIDLQPTLLSGFTDSRAIGTNGAKQIGNGTRTDLSTHALVWSGTAGSAVDLNPSLPAGFTSSEADLIDSQGIIYGEALDAAGNIHAVQWTPVVAGDYNRNGIVDAADYTIWRDSLGSIGTGLVADGTGPAGVPDGVVDQLDYDFWKANFGQMAGNGSSANAAVPESASILLAALGFIALAIYCGSKIQ